MKKIFVLIGAAMSLYTASAQNYENPWSVGLYGVKTEYNGDFGNKFFDPTDKFYGGGAISFSRYLSKYFDVTLYGFYGFHGAKDELGDTNEEFHANMFHADLTLKYKILQEKYALRPFVYLGPGYRQLTISGEDGGNVTYADGVAVRTGNYRCKDGGDIMVTGGIGCDFALSDHWALRYMCGYGYTFADDKDERECGDFNDQQLLHSLGVTYSFSFKPRDKDKDGIPDKLDKCPNNTPEELSKGIDENGCPKDTDGDGVADYLDECPGTPSGVKVDAKGCPVDTDKDGVADYLDKCPNNTPEEISMGVDANGCPKDTDGDGVADYLDKCPDTPAAAQGKIDANGCPIDTDGDGIADYEDVCPNEAGVKENNGCPEVKEAVKQLFKKALNGIQFETGKATIKKSSNKILDDVVKVMQENPSYKLFIGGHTDNTGKAEKNLQLSEDRAAAVRQYLEKKGVESARMKSKGFGQEKPVADNKTAKGRAENRRVEFRVVFEK